MKTKKMTTPKLLFSRAVTMDAQSSCILILSPNTFFTTSAGKPSQRMAHTICSWHPRLKNTRKFSPSRLLGKPCLHYQNWRFLAGKWQNNSHISVHMHSLSSYIHSIYSLSRIITYKYPVREQEENFRLMSRFGYSHVIYGMPVRDSGFEPQIIADLRPDSRDGAGQT